MLEPNRKSGDDRSLSREVGDKLCCCRCEKGLTGGGPVLLVGGRMGYTLVLPDLAQAAGSCFWLRLLGSRGCMIWFGIVALLKFGAITRGGCMICLLWNCHSVTSGESAATTSVLHVLLVYKITYDCGATFSKCRKFGFHLHRHHP